MCRCTTGIVEPSALHTQTSRIRAPHAVYPRSDSACARIGSDNTRASAWASASLSPAGTSNPPSATTSASAPPSLDTRGTPAAIALDGRQTKPLIERRHHGHSALRIKTIDVLVTGVTHEPNTLGQPEPGNQGPRCLHPASVGNQYQPVRGVVLTEDLKAFNNTGRPFKGASADAVAMIVLGCRTTSGRGLNRSVSTPLGTTCSAPGSTPKSVLISAAEHCDTVTMWRSCPATLACILRKVCQRRIIRRHHQRDSPARATLRSRVIG